MTKSRTPVTVDAEATTAAHDAIEEYEAEHGVITDADIAAQQRADRANAVVVRGRESAAGTPVGPA